MHVNNLISLFVLLGFTFLGCKQNKNDEENASNAGSVILDKPAVYIERLPKILSENSALLCGGNLIWTCNDSGGENKIYGLTSEGNIVREVEVKNAQNQDWEAMAQDDDFIYIGDFGNNNGNRKDLKIYKISKKEVEESTSVEASEINFSFGNQKQFSFSPHAHRFDCEAIAGLNDELFLFSKDWETETTTVYKVPKKEGNYNLQPLDSFQVNGLITGADFSPDKTKLALVGYHNFKPVLRLFYGVSGDNIFGTEHLFISIDALEKAQTEGVCFWGNDTLLVSCEKTSQFPAQVFLIDLTAIQPNGTY